MPQTKRKVQQKHPKKAFTKNTSKKSILSNVGKAFDIQQCDVQLPGEKTEDKQRPTSDDDEDSQTINSERPETVSQLQTVKTVEYGLAGWVAIVFSCLVVLLTFPFSLLFCLKHIRVYQRGILLRLGKLLQDGTQPSGMLFTLPCVDTFVRIDSRTKTHLIQTQKIMTTDACPLEVSLYLYYRVVNALKCVMAVGNPIDLSDILARTIMQDVISSKSYAYVIRNKETICETIKDRITIGLKTWGILVEKVAFQDVALPVGLQAILLERAESEAKLQNKLEEAEQEKLAARALEDATNILSRNPGCLQIRYLQTVKELSTKNPSTIIFPIPISMVSGFGPKPKTNKLSAAQH